MPLYVRSISYCIILSYNIIKSDNHIISYTTSYMIDLTQLRQFHILIYLEVDLSFIICHLTYLTFSINLYNQLFELFFTINLFNQSILN